MSTIRARTQVKPLPMQFVTRAAHEPDALAMSSLLQSVFAETYGASLDEHVLQRHLQTHLSRQALLKEMNVSKRATESNFLRVGQLIADNKEELKKYLKKSLPNYS